MLLFFDTCALLDINSLIEQEKIDFTELLTPFRLGISHELDKEYENYHLKSLLQIDFTINIRPEERTTYANKYLLTHLDAADQELFITGLRDASIIISNDRDLILQCQAYQIECHTLWSFLVALVRSNLMPKKTFYKCLHHWQITKRYSKVVLKKIKQIYHTLSNQETILPGSILGIMKDKSNSFTPDGDDQN